MLLNTPQGGRIMPKLSTREKEVRFKVSADKYDLLLKHAKLRDETVSSFARHEVLGRVQLFESRILCAKTKHPK